MARKKVVPEYGTIMKRGVQYYRTRMQDADGKWISLYAPCESTKSNRRFTDSTFLIDSPK